MGFTGRLRDQTAFWSVIVGGGPEPPHLYPGESLAKFVMAGNTVGGATLKGRFFTPPRLLLFRAFMFLFVRVAYCSAVLSTAVFPNRLSAAKRLTHKGLASVCRYAGKTGVPPPPKPDAMWRDAVGAIIVVLWLS